MRRAWSASKGYVKINLQILEGNKTVTAFYASLGYSVEQRISMGKRIWPIPISPPSSGP
jgi:hypothetical protein